MQPLAIVDRSDIREAGRTVKWRVIRIAGQEVYEDFRQNFGRQWENRIRYVRRCVPIGRCS
jgi:hypothetical protein